MIYYATLDSSCPDVVKSKGALKGTVIALQQSSLSGGGGRGRVETLFEEQKEEHEPPRSKEDLGYVHVKNTSPVLVAASLHAREPPNFHQPPSPSGACSRRPASEGGVVRSSSAGMTSYTDAAAPYVSLLLTSFPINHILTVIALRFSPNVLCSKMDSHYIAHKE